MATQEEIIAVCKSFLEEVFKERGVENQDVPNDAHLIRRGFLDSMDVLELIATLEDEFGVEFDFSEEDPDEIMSIDGLVGYCYNLSQSK